MNTVILVACLTTLVWTLSCNRLGVLNRWHHFHLGAAVLVAGALLGLTWLAIVGVVVMADDAVQHAVQLRWPAFRSPLHLLYRHTLYKWTHKAAT